MRSFGRNNNPQIIRTPIEILNGATDPEMAAITVTEPTTRSNYQIEKDGSNYLVKVNRHGTADYQDKFRLNADGSIDVTSNAGVSWRKAEDHSLERFNFVIAEFDRINASNIAVAEQLRQQQGIQVRLQGIKDTIQFLAPRVSFKIGENYYECSGDNADDLIIRKVTGDRVEDFARIQTAADGSISFSKKGTGVWVPSTDDNDFAVLEGALTNRTEITQQQADMDDVCRAMPANVEVRIGDDAFIRTVNGGASTLHSYSYVNDLVEGAITELPAGNVPEELKNSYITHTEQPFLKDARALAANFITVLDRDIIDGGNKVTKSTLPRTVYNFDGKKYYQAAVGGILHEVDAAGNDVALDSIGIVGKMVGIEAKLQIDPEERRQRKAIAENVKKAGWTGSVEIPVPAQLTADLLRTASDNNAEIDFNGITYRCAPFGTDGARYSISSADTSSVFIVEVPSAGDLKVTKVSRSRILSRSKAKIESDLKADAELLAGITGQFSANVQATSVVRDGIIGDIGDLTDLIFNLSAADVSLAGRPAQELAHDFLNLTNIFIPDIADPNSAVFYNSVSKKSLLSSRGGAVRDVLETFARENAERFAASPNHHLQNLAAIFYLNGIGVAQDKDRARGLLQDLEAEEYIPAKSNIVEGFYRRDPAAPLMDDAVLEADAIRDLAKEVSDAGYAPGQYVYGLLHERKLCGVGAVLSDNARETEAISLYEKAANRGVVKAKSRAAEYYFGKDEAKMLRYATEAANSGDADAQYTLSRHYAAKENWDNAVSYGELACNQDQTNARYQNNLGTALEGRNGAGDKTRAFGLYSDAAAQGYELGLYNLQRLYREEGPNKNDEKADILENLLSAVKEDREVTAADGVKWKVEYYFDDAAPANSGFVIKTNPADPALERHITFRQISGKDEDGYEASKDPVLEIVDLIKDQILHETNIGRFTEILEKMPKDILVKQGEYYFVATGTPVELHQYKFNVDGSVDRANSRIMNAAYRDRDHLQIVVDALYDPATNAPKVVVGKTLSELSKQCFEIIKNDPDANRDGGMTTAVYAYDGRKYYLGGTFSSALYEMNANGTGQKALSILEVITKAHEVEVAQYQRGVAVDGITEEMKTELINGIKVDLGDADGEKRLEAIAIANEFLGLKKRSGTGAIGDEYVYYGITKQRAKELSEAPGGNALKEFAAARTAVFAASPNPNLRNLAGVFCELGIDVSPIVTPVPNDKLTQALGHYQEAANTGSHAAMDNVIRCYKDGVSLDAGISGEDKNKFARRGTTLEALRWAVENQVRGVTYDPRNPGDGFVVTFNRGNAEVNINVTADNGFDEEGLEERIKEIERQKASTRGIIIPDGLDESMLIDAKVQGTMFNLGTASYLCSKDGSGYNVIDQNNGGKFGYRVTFKEGLPTVTKIVKKDRASTWAGYSEYKATPFDPKDHAEFAAIIRNWRGVFDQVIVQAKTQIFAAIDAARVADQPTVEELKTEVRRLIDPTEADEQKLAEATKIVESFLGISDSFVDQAGEIHFYGQHVKIGEEVKKVLEDFAKANREAFAAPAAAEHLKLLAFNSYYTDEEPIVDGNRTAQKTAFEIVKTLAEAGNPGAKNRLGVCYQEGFGVKKDAAKAKKLFKEAADQGYPIAYYRLATTYSNDRTTLGTINSYYETSANLGLVSGMHQTGMNYLKYNPRFKRDYTKAVQYFQEAAKHDYAPSLYQLGVCYEKGMGVVKDPALAFENYEKAAMLGNADAIESLARCYSKGVGVNKSQENADRLEALLMMEQIGAVVDFTDDGENLKIKVEFDSGINCFVIRDIEDLDAGPSTPVFNVRGCTVEGLELLDEILAKAALEKPKVEARKTTRIQQATRQVTGAIRTPEKLEGEYGRELLERASENQTEVCYLGQNYRCFFVRNHDGTIAHDGTTAKKKNSYVLYPIDHEGKREESKPRYEISFSGNPLSTTVTKLNSTVLGRNLGLNLSLFGESRASVVNSSSEDGFFAKLVDKIDTVERSRQTNFIAVEECQAVTDLALEDFATVNPDDNVRASFEIDVGDGEKEKYEITRYGDEYQFDKIINHHDDGEKATRSYKIIDLAGNPILQIPDDANGWIDCDDSAEFAKVQKLLVALDSVDPATATITKQDAQYRDALREMEKDQQYSHDDRFFIKTVGEGGSTTLYQYERDDNGLVTNIKKDPATATEPLPDKAFLHDAVNVRGLTDIRGLTDEIEAGVLLQLNTPVPVPAPPALIPDGYGKRKIGAGEKYTYSAKGVEYCIEGDVLHKVEYVVDEKEWLTIQSPKPYYKATPLNAFEIVQASSDFIARQQQEADDLVIKDLIAAVRVHITGEDHVAEEKATQIVHDFLGFNNRGTRLYPTARPDNEVSREIKTILRDFAVDQITNHDRFDPAARVVALVGDAPEFSSPALLKNVVAVFCENNVGLARGLRPAERMEAARDLYNESATAGNPHAQNNLGRLKEGGLIGVLQNQIEAFDLYKQAAAQGNKTGFENVARCLRRGNALDQAQAQANTLEVMQWATGHADLKDKRWSGWVRGEEYSVSEYNPQKGFVVRNSWNQEIARVKHDGSVVKVVKGEEAGEYDNFSAIVEQIKGHKEERAIENHILEGNVEKAQEALVIDLQKTPPAPAPMQQAEAIVFAKRFFESVTDRVSNPPERYQAKSELLASLTPEQRARLEEFTHAHVVAFSKSKSAQLKDLAGQIYFNGIGVDKDYAKARECLEGSVGKSYPMAEYHLAEIYLIGGRGVEKDERQAFANFEVAARQGFQPAIAALANCYMNGVGCNRNLDLAEALYDQNDPRNDVLNPNKYNAINGILSVNLALYPESAAVVAESKVRSGNDHEALDILRESTERDPRLYAKIGKIYEMDHQENVRERGVVVVRNVLASDAKAAEQYDLGARAGATNSMRALADLYDQGRASNSVLARSEYHADKLRTVANFFEACAQSQGNEDIRIVVPSSTKYFPGAKDVYQVSKSADGSYILSIDGKEKNGFKVDGKGNFYVRKEINGVVRDIYEERGFQENPVFLKVKNAMILSNNEQVRVSASGIEDHILQDLTEELRKINVANPEIFARDFLGLNPESGANFGGNNNAATLRYCHGNNFREINNVEVREVLKAFAVKNRKYCEASERPHLRNLAGMFYEMGLFGNGNPDYIGAKRHYIQAANKGYVPAEHNFFHANKNIGLIDEVGAISTYKLVANKGYLPSVKAAADIISNQVVHPFANPDAPTAGEIAAFERQKNAEFLSNLAEMRINGKITLHINNGTAQQKSYVVSDYDPDTGFTLNLIDRTGLKSKEGFRVVSLEDRAPQIHKIGANGRDMPIDAAAQNDLTEILTVLKRNNEQIAQQDKECLDAAHKPVIRSLKTAMSQVADVAGVKPSLKKPPEVHKEKVKKEEVLTPEVLKKVKAAAPKVKVDPNLDKAVPKSSCTAYAATRIGSFMGLVR